MKTPLLSSTLISLLALLSCASSTQTDDTQPISSTTWQQYIVSFRGAAFHTEALAQQAQTLQQWREASGAAEIEYLRSLMKIAWVIRAAGVSEETLIKTLQNLPGIQSVEVDQIIRISPMETQPVPPQPAEHKPLRPRVY